MPGQIEKQIEQELVQLVYFAHLSYLDCLFMNYNTRQIWFKEVDTIIKKQNGNGEVSLANMGQ
jgi:hypothetical protein